MSDDSSALAKYPEWVQNYIHSTEKQRNLYRRTLTIVVISQIFGGAGLGHNCWSTSSSTNAWNG